MGIVIKHSSWNLVITVFGFLFGAFNTLQLAVIYLEDEFYGLWGYVLSTAFLLFPLLSFGVHNTIVKYYSSYYEKQDRDNFLSQMLLWPLFILIPLVGFLFVFYDPIRLLISSKNQIVGDYLWVIILVALFQSYFEIFYAWTKVHLKTIAGNFLKEVFYRVAAMIVLLLVAAGMLTQVQFIYSLVLIYFLRMLVMAILALRTYKPSFHISKITAVRELLWYSILMIIAGSVGTAMIDLDKSMLNQYVSIENISYYNVAIFVATVIAIPARGMAQIVHPLTAGFFNQGDTNAVEHLYKRSSLNLAIVAGLLVVLIVCNVKEFYNFLPVEFSVAMPVVFLIAIVKYSENLLGSNNAILYNTNLYQWTLWLGLLFAIIAVLLNLWLIPVYGLIGAAIATCVAYLIYAFAKAYYVYLKLSIHPWTKNTSTSMLVLVLCVTVFYPWDFPFDSWINIGLKSAMICVVYITLVYFLKLSKEVNSTINDLLLHKKRSQ